MVADYYQGKARQKFVGIQVAVMSLGGIIFITLGGVLADISWRVPFLLYLFSLLIIPFAYLFLKEPNKTVEAKAEVNLTKSPRIIWFVFVNIMLMWILFFIIPIQIPFYLKSIGVEKNALIGIAIASTTFFSAIGAISFSKIKDKFSFKQIFGFGYLLMAISFFCISYGDSLSLVMLAMMLAGLGMGVMIPNANVWVMQLAPPEIRGREIGRLTTFWFMGQFLSPIIFLPFLDWLTHSQLFFMISCFLLVLSILMFGFYFASKKSKRI